MVSRHHRPLSFHQSTSIPRDTKSAKVSTPITTAAIVQPGRYDRYSRKAFMPSLCVTCCSWLMPWP